MPQHVPYHCRACHRNARYGLISAVALAGGLVGLCVWILIRL